MTRSPAPDSESPPRIATTMKRWPPIAWRNVSQGGNRTLAAVAGIAFSTAMVLLELGFLHAVTLTAKSVYDELDFDIVLHSPDYSQLYDCGSFPLQRLHQVEAIDGVVRARPLYAMFAMWRCPPDPPDTTTADADAAAAEGPLPRLLRILRGEPPPRATQRRELLAIGVDLDDPPFLEPIRSQIAENRDELRLPGRLLLSERSHPDFGWESRLWFAGWELGRRSAEVVGGFDLARGFGADGSTLSSIPTFAQATGWPHTQRVQFGLVDVEPGRTAEVLDRLRLTLPPDVVARSRSDLLADETSHWVRQTSTGRIFGFGVGVSMLVAAVVAYQVLSNDIRSRVAEYATLMAMGHSPGRLRGVVIRQALLYAILAIGPALALTYGLYVGTERIASVPMRWTPQNVAIALSLTLLACLGSALLTLRRLQAADPAELY